MKKIVFILAAITLLALAAPSFASVTWDTVNANILSSTDTSATFNGAPKFIKIDYTAPDIMNFSNNMVLSFTVSGVAEGNATPFAFIMQYHSNPWHQNVYNLGTFTNGNYTVNLGENICKFILSDGTVSPNFTAGDAINRIGFLPNAILTDNNVSGYNALPASAYVDSAKGITISNVKFTAVPEPATFAYGAMGLLSLLGLKKKLNK